MRRPKGTTQKTAQDAQKAVHGTEAAEATIAPVVEQEEPETAKAEMRVSEKRQFLYHREFQPRIFGVGEAIPAGWTGPDGILGVIWKLSDAGTWEKIS